MRRLCAFFLFAVLSLAHGEEGAPRPGSGALEGAKRAARDGKLTEALAVLDAPDKQRPPTSDSLDLRGVIYLEQEKFDDATKAFEAAHAADDALFLPRLHLGDVLFRQKKFEEARSVYERLLRQTNVLTSSERLRYAILLCRLGARDEVEAQSAYGRISFPTETPAYYYAQAAWQYAHSRNRDAKKWLRTAEKIFDETATAWFARPLYDLGWIKDKPPLAVD